MTNKYGFYGRLKEDMPSQIIIDIDENCNYECVHCPHGKFRKSEVYTGARLDESLNKKIVDEVNKIGKGNVQQIRYAANGEPLLHPKAIDMLCYASERSRSFVSLTTNGSLLNEEKSRSLLESGIGLIDISLDAYTEETYSKVRVYGSLERVRSNVIQLIDLKEKMNSRTLIVVSFVKQPLNENEVSDFVSFWEKNGVYQAIVRELHTAGGSMLGNKSDNDNLEYQPCVYPWERICIGPRGNIEFCPASWAGKTELGVNIRDVTIHDIWNGEKYKKLRDEHIKGCFDTYRVCRDCPDRNHIIWPDKDGRNAYGDMIAEIWKGKLKE